mgnify:CR=1 FL=1
MSRENPTATSFQSYKSDDYYQARASRPDAERKTWSPFDLQFAFQRANTRRLVDRDGEPVSFDPQSLLVLQTLVSRSKFDWSAGRPSTLTLNPCTLDYIAQWSSLRSADAAALRLKRLESMGWISKTPVTGRGLLITVDLDAVMRSLEEAGEWSHQDARELRPPSKRSRPMPERVTRREQPEQKSEETEEPKSTKAESLKTLMVPVGQMVWRLSQKAKHPMRFRGKMVLSWTAEILKALESGASEERISRAVESLLYEVKHKGRTYVDPAWIHDRLNPKPRSNRTAGRVGPDGLSITGSSWPQRDCENGFRGEDTKVPSSTKFSEHHQSSAQQLAARSELAKRYKPKPLDFEITDEERRAGSEKLSGLLTDLY